MRYPRRDSVPTMSLIARLNESARNRAKFPPRENGDRGPRIFAPGEIIGALELGDVPYATKIERRIVFLGFLFLFFYSYRTDINSILIRKRNRVVFSSFVSSSQLPYEISLDELP